MFAGVDADDKEVEDDVSGGWFLDVKKVLDVAAALEWNRDNFPPLCGFVPMTDVEEALGTGLAVETESVLAVFKTDWELIGNEVP